MNKYSSTLWVAIAVLLCTSLTHAQFNAGIYSLTPLTEFCDRGAPLGPECSGVIIWDHNNNGPDQADFPPIVGDGFGECNFNTFPINGAEFLDIPGTFFTETYFTISSNTPQPSRYYVVVESPYPRWTSAVFTILDGLNDYDISQGWTCEDFVPPCDEPTRVEITAVPGWPPQTFECIRLCAGLTVEVCFVNLPPPSECRHPFCFVVPGCFSTWGCNVECFPAQFSYDDSRWVYDEANGTWCNTIQGGSDGCVCFVFEGCFPVEDINFNAIARDSEVELLWTTASESDMASFEVMRRIQGHEYEKVTSLAATNSTSESSYSFVDENVENGTVYEYTLQMIDLNGGVEELGEIATAIPSADHAIITEYALHQNYPNPFNPNTSIVFDVLEQNNVNLRVFNSMGQEVATLVNGSMSSGRHTVNFDASNLTSGLYFYTVKIGTDFTATKKMLLIK